MFQQISHRWLFLVLLASACVVALVPPAHAADATALNVRDVLVHGSSTMYWVARVEQETGSAPIPASPASTSAPVKSYIQSRLINGKDWSLVGRINARVISLADRGSQVAVLLESGDWMLLWPEGGVTGALPNDGAQLTMLASGTGDALHAIASAGAARLPASTMGSTQPAATLPVGTRLLYKLTGNNWQMVCPLPEVALQGQLSFEVNGDKPTIAVLTDGIVRTFIWHADRTTWEPAGEFNAGSDTRRIKLLTGLPQLQLWAGGNSGAGSLFQRRDNGQWSDAIKLVIPPDQALPDSPRDPAVGGESIRLVVAGEKTKLTEFAFGAGGTFQGGAPLAIPQTMPGARPVDWGGMILTAVLMALLFNSFRQRSDEPRTVAEATLMNLAPIGRRFLAGLIDAIPVVGTLVYALIKVGPSAFMQISTETEPLPELLAVGGAVLIYLLHTLFSEALWGYTIGKRLCGLRVIAMDGQAPTRGALVLRNMLRAIDVMFWFIPSTLVLFTPLRQRLGDLAADTLVVLDTPVVPPSDDEAPPAP